jgi:uncharacterized membrane protein YdjX (TVP38/TMEM64 family)
MSRDAGITRDTRGALDPRRRTVARRMRRPGPSAVSGAYAAADTRSWRVGLGGVAIALLVAGVWLLAGAHRWLSLAEIQSHRDALAGYAAEHYAVSLAIAFGAYAGMTAMLVPGGAVLSVCIGFVFGRWVGTSVIVAGATLGAGVVFAATRYLFAASARARAGPLATRLERRFRANAVNYILFLRFTPVCPAWFVNTVPALTTMPMRDFLLATCIGAVPLTFVYANLGQSLGSIASTGDLVSWRVLGSLSLLGFAALAPIALKRSGRGHDPSSDVADIEEKDHARHASAARTE